MQLRLKLGCFVIAVFLASACLGDDKKGLEKIQVPKVTDFIEGTFDVSKPEVISWMQDIETFLSTTDFDYSVRAEILEELLDNQSRNQLFGWSHSFRRAFQSETRKERLISVRQNLLDKPEIAVGAGTVVDRQRHLDCLREGERIRANRVTAMELHLSEEPGEGKWKDLLDELRLLGIFCPCLASTVSPHQVSMGYAFDFSQHNLRSHSIAAVLKDPAYVHVLLRYKGEDTEAQVITFQDRVPVQFVEFNWEGTEPASARKVAVVRSLWVAPTGSDQKLPVKIVASRVSSGRGCDITADISWKVGEQVNDSLFDASNLGFINPVPDSNFGVPLLLRE